jgi:hypothetical protein
LGLPHSRHANRSLKLAPASIVAPDRYSMIIWAVIIG